MNDSNDIHEKYELITVDSNNTLLTIKSKNVELDKDNYLDDIKALKDFCKTSNSFAISGIQLGVEKRIVYLYQNNTSIINKVLINPVVVSKKGLSEYWEACSSVPGKIGLVERSYSIEVEYHDEKKIVHREEFKNLDATIVQHELDHLDGVLFINKAEQVFNMNADSREQYRKEHPYKIISKE